jgi:hypothetical protein
MDQKKNNTDALDFFQLIVKNTRNPECFEGVDAGEGSERGFGREANRGDGALRKMERKWERILLLPVVAVERRVKKNGNGGAIFLTEVLLGGGFGECDFYAKWRKL